MSKLTDLTVLFTHPSQCHLRTDLADRGRALKLVYIHAHHRSESNHYRLHLAFRDGHALRFDYTIEGTRPGIFFTLMENAIAEAEPIESVVGTSAWNAMVKVKTA